MVECLPPLLSGIATMLSYFLFWISYMGGTNATTLYVIRGGLVFFILFSIHIADSQQPFTCGHSVCGRLDRQIPPSE